MAKRKVFEAVINAAQELRKLGGTQAERMARAAEQGHSIARGENWYHGTWKGGRDSMPENSYLTSSPEMANSYTALRESQADEFKNDAAFRRVSAPTVYPLSVKDGNYLDLSHLQNQAAPLITKGNEPIGTATNPIVEDRLAALFGTDRGALSAAIMKYAEENPARRWRYDRDEIWSLASTMGAFDPKTGNDVTSLLTGGYNEQAHPDVVGVLKNLGYDGVKFNDYAVSGAIGDKDYAQTLVVFDPANIRSVNADFNPEHKDSSNLLAGVGGIMPYAAGTAALLAGATPQEAEAGPLQSLGRAAPYLTSAALGGAAALQSGDAEAGKLDALGRAAPYLATGALGAAMMTPQEAQAEPISIMPPTYNDTMQRTQAAMNKIDEFKAKRANKRGAMDIMKLELQTLLKGANEVANDVIFPALDKPLQGYLGLSEVFGSLAQGRGFDTAMQRGAQVAAQPVDATTYNMGGTVTDSLSPYVPAPVAAGAGALTHAGALLASPF